MIVFGPFVTHHAGDHADDDSYRIAEPELELIVGMRIVVFLLLLLILLVSLCFVSLLVLLT